MSGTFIKERNSTTDRFRTILGGEWDHDYWLKWHAQNWAICIPLAIGYMIAVYYGNQLMKNRKPYNLRLALGLWSALLGVFSIMGSYYLVPEIISKLYNDGFHATACDNTYKSNKDYMFWAWLFTWSKVFEFGDTAFILLRKQKLTFLHWYHHAMTVICVFAYFPGGCSISRWTGSMNYFIHSIMYTYYSFKAFRIYIPRFISFIITISQIAQMFVGFYVAGYIFLQKQKNTPCEMTKNMSIFSLTIYITYFVLFLNFFVQTYFLKRPTVTRKNISTTLDKKTTANGLCFDENDNLSKEKVQ